MKQAVMTTPGQIEIRDVAEPSPGPGQALLRIKRIGVCGSDIHVNHGEHPSVVFPVVQGHEFSAEIVALGEGVDEFRVGMKATATPQEFCGQCRPCKRGDYNICDSLKVRGFHAPGVAQDLCVTEAEKIVPLPDSFTWEQGALVEPTAVAARSTGLIGDLAGKNVAVLGAGPIGNLVAQVAQLRGAEKVLITDLSDYRLEIAQQCGIENVSNASSESLAEGSRRVFGAEGFQIAFEAVGVEATLDQAVDAIEKGGDIVVLGVFGERPRIDMAMVGEHELSLIGTMMYKYEDYQAAVEMISSGQIVTDPLVTRHFSFEQYADAYAFIDEQGDKSMKVMIDL